MKFKINNTRELKSLNLLNKIKKLNFFLENPKNCGIFITCANLHPTARIETHEKFLEKNLKITKISHKLIKIIFKLNTKEVVRNLFSGPVYLIEDKLNTLLSKDNLNTILAHKQFTFRFLYLNQQIYRSEEVFTLLESIANPKNIFILTLKSKQILLF